MRVTVIAPGPESEGGIRSVVSSIVPRLEARDDVEIVWIASHRTGSAISKVGSFIIAFCRSLYYLPRSSVLHVHGSVGTSLLRKSVFIWLASLFRCKSVYHFHATQSVFEDYFSRPGLRKTFIIATLRKCKAIAVLSESWAETVRMILPDSEIVVVYNPVLDMTAVRTNNTTESSTVIYLAHLIERKGYADLIRAFKSVVSSVRDARLVFCGSGDIDRGKELCDELEIRGNVEFLGWVSDTEKVQQLSRASVFCLPSYDEGLPMGVLEAMSAGVAVVTTPVGGIPDVLTSEENALLFEPGDIATLSEQLIRLLTDPDLRRRLAREALKASTKFDPGNIAEAWFALYRRVDRDIT